MPLEKTEIAATVAADIIRKVKAEAAGMLGVNWPLAEKIAAAEVHGLLDELMDCDPAEEGRGPPGNYL